MSIMLLSHEVRIRSSLCVYFNHLRVVAKLEMSKVDLLFWFSCPLVLLVVFLVGSMLRGRFRNITANSALVTVSRLFCSVKNRNRIAIYAYDSCKRDRNTFKLYWFRCIQHIFSSAYFLSHEECFTPIIYSVAFYSL